MALNKILEGNNKDFLHQQLLNYKIIIILYYIVLIVNFFFKEKN